MKGSKYDTSTDVFSLGLILFEMVYPLYTAHERYKEFSGIRRGAFPIYWDSHVKTSFPSLHDILVRMISPVPSKRPSAADVSEHIDNLLSEYQVQSLDKSWGRKGAILLRVETNEAEGVLAKAMKLIKAAAPSAVILQYGLRGQASKAIMEFAIEINVDQKHFLEKISSSLRSNEMIVRQISNQ
jgi:serine/threonine protein kinase